ncbi:hypothetical protein T06_5796, partial [Trichinella sp. T6]
NGVASNARDAACFLAPLTGQRRHFCFINFFFYLNYYHSSNILLPIICNCTMLFCTSLFLGILVDLVRAQIQSIHCYYCASPMPPQTDDYEKHVAKLFFSKLFSLPPISDNCNDATPDALFKLSKQTCRNSNCTKITVTTEGKF